MLLQLRTLRAMPPKRDRPDGVPANWSAWKLTNAEQAPCHMLFPLACEVRLREYVEEFESSFEGTEEDKKDRTLLRVSESPFAGCGEEVSPRKRGCDEDGEGQGGHRQEGRKGKD